MESPFIDVQDSPRNFATGKQMDVSLADHLIKCIEIGERENVEFKKDYLQEKSVKLFVSIHNVKFNVALKQKASQHLDLKKETLKFMRVIEIARLRG